jgi:hypothetical protein
LPHPAYKPNLAPSAFFLWWLWRGGRFCESLRFWWKTRVCSHEICTFLNRCGFLWLPVIPNHGHSIVPEFFISHQESRLWCVDE